MAATVESATSDEQAIVTELPVVAAGEALALDVGVGLDVGVTVTVTVGAGVAAGVDGAQPASTAIDTPTSVPADVMRNARAERVKAFIDDPLVLWDEPDTRGAP
ncbi:hypothetical protein B7R22_16355 [Subtercola boreus]|uniref:Uncharacterized protein n=1 Tax=Subtercola boreus TaxID=120213 RepID=A0A3E0VR66_9MICO|nr:hypothetical protein B7R22_16355 [Subtercola boreus]